MSWTKEAEQGLKRRRLFSRAFRVFVTILTFAGVFLLALLLIEVARAGLPWLGWDFVSRFPSRFPERAGIKAAIFGTLWLIGLTAGLAIPLGVATAIYLEEYAVRGRLSRLIEINISNLAGVPSIVYGILGLVIFVRALGLERSLIAGALTMSLLVLPVVITASREAIRAVPPSLRLAAYGLGATRWQVIRAHVLPAALPGILTGVILSLSRAIGETAPLLMIGAASYVAFVPSGPTDEFTVLPIQIYNWASRPQAEFQQLAAAGILVLLAVLLLMNAAAVFIRWKFERKPS